ncbi:glycosyltransferase [Rhizobium leguminosarum]|uniref:glycosyltransferase n=1 Tax=Rhizobium leguminosarum TaxID=384 RepID=UPI001C961203|nr:glycosyltransferase [Rhizobium leguminosarum]MBY5904167.1 glycosyltransferase [Rhizobium leguminosarum]MBY5911536.1 glycosyltransferase [Rhizobium leguminosarum]
MADEFTHDVFLSHSSKDKAIVRSLAEGLRSAGLQVWFDEWEMQPGDAIFTKLEEGLEHSRVLALCMSANAFASDWAELESTTIRFRDPLNRERRFVPIRLDETPAKGSLANFLSVSWNPNSPDIDLQRIVTACRGERLATKRRQNIGMLSSEFPPHTLGGLGVHVAHLCEQLGPFVDVNLVLPHRKTIYADPPKGVRLRPLSSVTANYDEPLSWLHFAQHAFDLVKRMSPRPEIIHCHDWVTVLAGVRCRWELSIPLVFHVHLPNRTPFCASIENLGLVCADLVTVNSQAMAEQLQDRFPVKKIAVIPNGVDTDVFRPGNEANQAELYVFFAGRLVEQKGVDHLLRAFVHVAKRLPSLQLKIAGTGPCEPAYKRMAESLLISDRVQFLGWKSSSELSELYRAAAVVAVPSMYEPFGMTALEAMACARPVVASNTGGLREIVKHQVTGFLVEPGDHLDLAQWLIRLLERESLRREIGTNAGHQVHNITTHKWPEIARQYAEIYYKLSGEGIPVDTPSDARVFVEQIKGFTAKLDYGAQQKLVGWLR